MRKADHSGNALPNASHLLPIRTGNPLPQCSNTLMGMARDRNAPRTEDVLAENYKALRELAKAGGLWKGPGVSTKTANNVENARHNTKLTTIIALAAALGVEPFQLLIPVKDTKFLAVM